MKKQIFVIAVIAVVILSFYVYLQYHNSKMAEKAIKEIQDEAKKTQQRMEFENKIKKIE